MGNVSTDIMDIGATSLTLLSLDDSELVVNKNLNFLLISF